MKKMKHLLLLSMMAFCMIGVFGIKSHAATNRGTYTIDLRKGSHSIEESDEDAVANSLVAFSSFDPAQIRVVEASDKTVKKAAYLDIDMDGNDDLYYTIPNMGLVSMKVLKTASVTDTYKLTISSEMQKIFEAFEGEYFSTLVFIFPDYDMGALSIDLSKGDATIILDTVDKTEAYESLLVGLVFPAFIGVDEEPQIKADSEGKLLDLDKDGAYDVSVSGKEEQVTYKKLDTCSCSGTLKFTLSTAVINKIKSYNFNYYNSWVFVLTSPEESADNPTVVNPSKVEDPAAPAHQVGETVSIGGASYKITSIEEGKQTVTYLKSENKNVKNADIPASINIDGKEYKVTEIAPGAFKNNKKLKKTTIGSNVEKIGAGAYKGCTNLKNIKIKTKLLTKKSVGSGAFKKIHPSAKCKVPKKSLKAYLKFLPKKGLNGKGQKITK